MKLFECWHNENESGFGPLRRLLLCITGKSELFQLKSSGALQFLNGMRHQPPAVGVWHPDSFVDSLVRKVSSIALKAKVKLMRRWMCLALNSEHRVGVAFFEYSIRIHNLLKLTCPAAVVRLKLYLQS